MKAKAKSAQSLRAQVEKWLAPRFATSVHVIAFSRTGLDNRRYVRVESQEAGAPPHVLFFFLHDEGHWSVFPPQRETPRMRVEQVAK